MISMHLNDVAEKQRERDRIAADMAAFEARKPVKPIPVTERRPANYADFRLPGSPEFHNKGNEA